MSGSMNYITAVENLCIINQRAAYPAWNGRFFWFFFWQGHKGKCMRTTPPCPSHRNTGTHTNKTHQACTARVLHKLFFPTSVHSGYSIAWFAYSVLMHSQRDRWFIINSRDIFKFIMCVWPCTDVVLIRLLSAYLPPRVHIPFSTVSVLLWKLIAYTLCQSSRCLFFWGFPLGQVSLL